MDSTQIQLLIDKRNIRWIQILAKLERVSSISTKNLGQSLKISSRTIGSDIKEIKDYFKQAITIDPSTTGYTFKITDKITYIEKKKELLEFEPLLVILSGIFYGEKFSITDWSGQLFLTDRTLFFYLKKLNPMLARYQLTMDYPILSLKGKEINIRNFFLAFFMKKTRFLITLYPLF